MKGRRPVSRVQLRSQSGQAQLEVLAVAPACLVVGIIALQLMAVGYAQILADGASEAGAIALLSGADPGPAVAAALPGWAADRYEVEVSEVGRRARIEIGVHPPSPLAGLADALRVESSATVAAPR